MTQTPAGWYPDPSQAGQQRYWDGTAWTEHVQPDAATAAAPATPAAPAAPAAPAYGAAATEPIAPAGATVSYSGAGVPPSRSGVPSGIVAVIAVIALLAGFAGGYLVGGRDDGGGSILGGSSDTISVGDSITADLTRGSQTIQLVLDSSRQVIIDVSSNDFDTTLTIYDEFGSEVAYNDDGGQDTDSRIDRFLDRGTYDLVVQQYGGGFGGGTFTIQVR